MNYFFITGTSRGIGKALCSKLLEDPVNRIVGISRSTGMIHPRYKHIQFDFAESNKIPETAEIFFKTEGVADKVVLINNAAILGEVGPFGTVEDKNLIDLYSINVIAPAVLMNSFIRKFNSASIEKIIINISSGAGSRPIDGWGGYCSSKAAINMMSEVAALENDLQKNNFNIYALAPGVVDTAMQAEIRNVDKEKFNDVERFIDMKKSEELSNPNETAEKILYLILNAHQFNNVIQDVRKY